MTVKEALRAFNIRIPVVLCGVTANKLGKLEFSYINAIILCKDRYGKNIRCAELVDNKCINSIVRVGIEDVEVSQSASEILKRMYQEMTTENEQCAKRDID